MTTENCLRAALKLLQNFLGRLSRKKPFVPIAAPVKGVPLGRSSLCNHLVSDQPAVALASCVRCLSALRLRGKAFVPHPVGQRRGRMKFICTAVQHGGESNIAGSLGSRT